MFAPSSVGNNSWGSRAGGYSRTGAATIKQERHPWLALLFDFCPGRLFAGTPAGFPKSTKGLAAILPPAQHCRGEIT
jgi:hypothetical protein